MSEVYKISKALEDLREYYGLKEIKHVRLNMEGDYPEISFVSNKPNLLSHMPDHDKHTMPDMVHYVLRLEILVDGRVNDDRNN